MERILVIGLNGAGKSTFANKLGKKLNLEVIHLDKVYYNSGWDRAYKTQPEWKQKVLELAAQDKWIIDGHYNSSLKLRIPRADTIIFFNFSKIICLYGVFKRLFNHNQPFDKQEGNLNRISWNLIRKIIIFDKKKLLGMLEELKPSKKIFVVKNRKEAEELLSILSLSEV